MKMLKERQLKMIKRLLLTVNPVSVDEFCELFSVSVRTVRYDLKEIVDFLQDHEVILQFRNNQGYFIKNNDKDKLFVLMNNDYLSIVEEEHIQNIKYLIFVLAASKRRLGTNFLARRLFVSQSTVSKLVQEVSKYTENEIEILANKDGYIICTDEGDLRKYLVKNLEEIFNRYFNLIDYYEVLPEVLKGIISKDRYLVIINTVNRINKEYQVWLSEQSFIHLIAYLLVMEVRINICQIDDSQNYDDSMLEAECRYSRQLLLEVFGQTDCVGEVNGLVKLLISKGIFISQLAEDDNAQLNSLLNCLIDYLKTVDIEVDLAGFRNDIRMHLLLSIKRKMNHGNEQKNVLLDQIKTNYPLHYQLSIDMAKLLNENTGFEFNEDDVGYLAIYLYKNSIHEKQQRKFRVIVVCATSRGASQLLVTRVTHVFPQIDVVGVMSITQINTTSDFKGVDFVISTAPTKNLNIPVVQVSILLNVKDIDKIKNLLTYGFSSKVISLPADYNINEFATKQFRDLGIDYRNTYISMEKLTKLILGTLDVMVEVSNDYQVTQEKMLGILIHLILAIPRWLNTYEELDHECQKELQQIMSSHKHLYQQVGMIFETVEGELDLVLTSREKLSFFDYIIEKENDYEK